MQLPVFVIEPAFGKILGFAAVKHMPIFIQRFLDNLAVTMRSLNRWLMISSVGLLSSFETAAFAST